MQADNCTPFLSILTPTWNRGYFLPRLYNSLQRQGFKDFEWIVVDDGSNDRTSEFMNWALTNSEFRIVYCKFSRRVGKVRCDNKLIELARGFFITWCDSDDAFLDGALAMLVESYSRLSDKDQVDLFGVSALCVDHVGMMQSTGTPPSESKVLTWGEIGSSLGIVGDMATMVKRSVVGKERFPEVDLVVTESCLWSRFFDKNILLVPAPIKEMIRFADNRISFTRRMEYCRGKAYGIVYSDFPKWADFTFAQRTRLLLNYHRYGSHGDLPVSFRRKLFGRRISILWIFALLLGEFLAFVDHYRLEVLKTHIIFLEAGDATFEMNTNVT